VTADVSSNTDDHELSIDDVGQRAGLPVRTIREYQAIGLVPPPRRRGRVGVYGPSHVARLELIARLQNRGYSLAGIKDLLGSWREGADLAEVLGLGPDQLVQTDEPGSRVTLEQLAALLPALVPERLDDLVAVGLVELCGPDRYCVPSPSMLQLSVDVLAAGYRPDAVLGLLRTVHGATTTIADAVVTLLAKPPASASSKQISALAARGRGLLAHGTGRLTVIAIARRLGIHNPTDAPAAARKRTPQR
jgi:DNA-binding transcriptional MerR regulator